MSAPGRRRKKPACAICGADQTARFQPFCSRRCADIDLNRWLTGQYAVPVVELDGNDLEALAPGAESGEAGDAEGGEILH